MLATAATGTRRRRRAAARPTAAPTSGPNATFCGRRPIAPATVPAEVPTATGPAPVTRPATHPSGATMAVVTAMRCHNSGISPGRCRARATASETPSPTAPTTAPTVPAFLPRWPMSAAPASPPMAPANATDPRRLRSGRLLLHCHERNLTSTPRHRKGVVLKPAAGREQVFLAAERVVVRARTPWCGTDDGLVRSKWACSAPSPWVSP